MATPATLALGDSVEPQSDDGLVRQQRATSMRRRKPPKESAVTGVRSSGPTVK
jgi:hypothetical protein